MSTDKFVRAHFLVEILSGAISLLLREKGDRDSEQRGLAARDKVDEELL